MNLDKMKFNGVLAASVALLFVGACSDDGGSGNGGDESSETSDPASATDSDSESDSDSASGSESASDSDTTVGDGDGDDSASGDGDGDDSASGDGDGDDSASGDGDGDDSASGDGDGDDSASGDGDGDNTTSGDGDGDDTTTGDGDGDMTGDGDGDPPPDPCGTTIFPVYRDFRPMQPDFGCNMWGNGARPGLVMDTLGDDQKPVYNPNPGPPLPGWNGSNPQITSADSFSVWYNTTEDVNIEIGGEIELVETAPNSGIYSFASNMFYPLTDMGFGNNVTPNYGGETYPNWNGAFTTEIHVEFQYQAGQTFTYTGDDDVWVFINGQLALDIGGLHGPVEDTVNLDDLGLQEGVYYDLDVFHAERCGSGSNFRIDTSISCIQPQ